MTVATSWKKGGCHCGAVVWEARLADTVVVSECNCSICRMTGYQHVIAPLTDFRLLRGEDHQVEYTFNKRIARHYFCRTCGVKSYYVPRSHPDGVSLNFRCMETELFSSVKIVPFDGENWEENAHSLPPLERRY